MKHLQISPTPSELLKLREKVAVRHTIEKSKISEQKLRIISLYQKIQKVNEIDPLFNISSSNLAQQTSLSPNKQTKKITDNKKQMRKTYAQNQKFQRYSTLVNSYIEQLDNPIKKQNSNNEIRDNCHKMSILKTLLSKYNSKFLGQGNYLKLINSFGLQIQPMKNLKRFRTTSGKYKSRSKIQIGSITEMETICNKERQSDKEKEYSYSNSFKIKLKQTNKVKFKQAQQLNGNQPNKNQPQNSPYPTQIPSSTNFYQETKQMYRTSILHQKDLRFKKTQNQRKGLSQTTKRSSYQQQFKYFLNSQQHNFQTRLTKYRQFLFIINYSNKIYRNLQIEQYVKPLKYYVGRGNNSNLIKSVMKNRFWWEESCLDEADFIWTQIKIENTFNIQKLADVDNEYDEIESHSDSKSFISSSLNLNNSPVNCKKGEKNTQTINPLKKGVKLLEPQQAQLKLLNESEYFQYLQMWKKYNPKSHFQSRIKHLKSIKFQQQKQSISSHLIHNHLPRNQLLGNKKAMFYCLRQYCKLKNKNVFDIVPLTYHIQNGEKDVQFKQFQDEFNRRKIKGKSNVWIIKPGEYTNRGNGISCSSKLKQIKQLISPASKLNKVKPNALPNQHAKDQIDKRTFIIQQYITRPLLYHNRKFDIRAYMLITSINGKVKGYWYQDGYIRTSSSIFNLQQLDDSMIHLTNDAIQKNGQQYSKYQPGNKITYNQLQRYINTLTNSTNAKNNKVDFYTMIYPEMKKIAETCLKSTAIYLDELKHQNNFELFGLDFMIDVNYRPWLIQINTNPCLELSCGILERIIPHLIENVMRVVIDPIFPPPTKYPFTKRYNVLENALYYNKFEIIYDEMRDGKELYLLFEQSKVLERIGEVKQDQQEFDNDGDIIGVEGVEAIK